MDKKEFGKQISSYVRTGSGVQKSKKNVQWLDVPEDVSTQGEWHFNVQVTVWSCAACRHSSKGILFRRDFPAEYCPAETIVSTLQAMFGADAVISLDYEYSNLW